MLVVDCISQTELGVVLEVVVVAKEDATVNPELKRKGRLVNTKEDREHAERKATERPKDTILKEQDVMVR